jgi:hypothetical protein
MPMAANNLLKNQCRLLKKISEAREESMS